MKKYYLSAAFTFFVFAALCLSFPACRLALADDAVYINSLGMEFVLIPAGTFVMGDNDSTYEGEYPEHIVTITRDFYLARHVVTQAQWLELMPALSWEFSGSDLPADWVSWPEAKEFIRLLNEREGTSGYRLPSEAEWEYAARAGREGRYPFDNPEEVDLYAWHLGNSDFQTQPVGQKLPTGRGLYDMSGNVWEWVEDWHSETYYRSSPGADPQGPARGDLKVARGGAWFDTIGNFVLTHRHLHGPDTRFSGLGFRLAFTPDQER